MRERNSRETWTLANWEIRDKLYANCLNEFSWVLSHTPHILGMVLNVAQIVYLPVCLSVCLSLCFSSILPQRAPTVFNIKSINQLQFRTQIVGGLPSREGFQCWPLVWSRFWLGLKMEMFKFVRSALIVGTSMAAPCNLMCSFNKLLSICTHLLMSMWVYVGLH